MRHVCFPFPARTARGPYFVGHRHRSDGTVPYRTRPADGLREVAGSAITSLRSGQPMPSRVHPHPMQHRGESTDDPVRTWLEFNRCFGASARVAARALACAGTPAEALRRRSVLAGELRLSASAAARAAQFDPKAVHADLDWLGGPRRSVLWLGHADYPRLLAEIPDPPPVLFVEGDAESLNWPMVAIVGSRNASVAGREIARDFARQLGEYGVGIVSGLALGIDGAAHRGALRSAAPTVAVCARGLDRTYPDAHRGLARAVSTSGAVVSEFPIGTPPLRPHFPRRNRIISGLSHGVLVVEASLRSGALITARQALDQGREVFAVPGSIRNPVARGCHQLIRNGAKVVEGVQDVLEEFAGLLGAQDASPEARREHEVAATGLDADALRTLECLGYEATPIDVLVGRAGLTADALSSILLSLELDGYVRSTPNGSYERLANME